MPASKDLGQDVGTWCMWPHRQLTPARPAWCVTLRPHGQPEDPVTGSLNASLAQWLIP